MTTQIFYWGKSKESQTLEDRIKELRNKDWIIVSICPTEFELRSNDVETFCTRAIIICSLP